MVIHQTAADVVLGFIWWACGHPPDDDPDTIAGVTGWALSLHGTKLLRVTDKFGEMAIEVVPLRIAQLQPPEMPNKELRSADVFLGLEHNEY